jgi:hypothetical protein
MKAYKDKDQTQFTEKFLWHSIGFYKNLESYMNEIL